MQVGIYLNSKLIRIPRQLQEQLLAPERLHGSSAARTRPDLDQIPELPLMSFPVPNPLPSGENCLTIKPNSSWTGGLPT